MFLTWKTLQRHAAVCKINIVESDANKTPIRVLFRPNLKVGIGLQKVMGPNSVKKEDILNPL